MSDPPDDSPSHAEAVAPRVRRYASQPAGEGGDQVERRHRWVAPTRDSNVSGWASAWSCPHCLVYSHQYWTPLYRVKRGTNPKEYEEAPTFAVSRCQMCDFEMVWYEDRILYPPVNSAEQPHPDLPSPARDTYLEAAAVLDASPRERPPCFVWRCRSCASRLASTASSIR